MLSRGLKIVALVTVLKNKEFDSSKKMTVGGLVLGLFLVIYYLLVVMYTYKTPWHQTQKHVSSDSYIKGQYQLMMIAHCN